MTYPKHCKRCHGDWNARIENPKYCPLCKTPLWNTEIQDMAKSNGAKLPRKQKEPATNESAV